MNVIGTTTGSAAKAILSGGLVAGVLDLTYATLFYRTQGVPAIRVTQAIASGLLGARAFKGGWGAAWLGIGLHFIIAISVAAIYYAASRRSALLEREPVWCGLAYGGGVFVFMHFVLVPLSASPQFKTSILSLTSDLAAHMLLIGVPIALAVARALRATRPV